jgi:hypothetical protein
LEKFIHGLPAFLGLSENLRGRFKALHHVHEPSTHEALVRAVCDSRMESRSLDQLLESYVAAVKKLRSVLERGLTGLEHRPDSPADSVSRFDDAD